MCKTTKLKIYVTYYAKLTQNIYRGGKLKSMALQEKKDTNYNEL